MGFSLKDVVPWGRSFEEYVAMFALSQDDLGQRIVACGDGPAGFNATLTHRGGRVVSVDPLYQCNTNQIRHRIHETYDVVMAQTRQNAHEFVWRHITSVEELGRVRKAAMDTFLHDYATGLRQRRYLPAALPALPFADQTFALALCSHFLFLYSKQFSLQFHVRSIQELCRVAAEARIFPLLELGSRPSRHLQQTLSQLQAAGLSANIETVPYEFQKGGNQMLRVRAG